MKNSLLIALMGVTLFVAGCGQPPSGGTTTGATTGTTTTTTTTTRTESPSPSPAVSGSPTTATGGETVTITEVNVQYTLPSGWKKDASGNLSTAEEDLMVMFLPTEAENVEAASEKVGEVIGTVLQNVKVEKESTEKNASGLEMASVEGTGEHEGKPVLWSVDIVQASPDSKPLIILEFAETTAYEKHRTAYDEFANSIAPIEGGAATGGDTASPSPDENTDADADADASPSPDAGSDSTAQ